MLEIQPEYDLLWKDVITEMFDEFLLFFSPDLYEQVDFSTPPEFLEQELQTIFPQSGSNRRLADKLVKLKLKNGNEQWIYIHIEVQGSYDKQFAKRMFQSFYRILDLYDKNIYALAIFTTDVSKYNLNEFHYEFYGTQLTYRFNSYRIASQTETSLLQSNNPFALAVLAGLYALQCKKNVDLKWRYKRKLMRLLLEDKILVKHTKKNYIQRLFIFIDHLLILPTEIERAFIRELSPIIEKEGTNLGLSLEDTSFAKFYRQQGVEEGKIEIAKKLLAKGMSIEEVAEITELPIKKVKELKE